MKDHLNYCWVECNASVFFCDSALHLLLNDSVYVSTRLWNRFLKKKNLKKNYKFKDRVGGDQDQKVIDFLSDDRLLNRGLLLLLISSLLFLILICLFHWELLPLFVLNYIRGSPFHTKVYRRCFILFSQVPSVSYNPSTSVVWGVYIVLPLLSEGITW